MGLVCSRHSKEASQAGRVGDGETPTLGDEIREQPGEAGHTSCRLLLCVRGKPPGFGAEEGYDQTYVVRTALTPVVTEAVGETSEALLQRSRRQMVVDWTAVVAVQVMKSSWIWGYILTLGPRGFSEGVDLRMRETGGCLKMVSWFWFEHQERFRCQQVNEAGLMRVGGEHEFC